MRIALIGYRTWALNIYSKIKDEFREYSYLDQFSEEDYSIKHIEEFQPDLILFYGWSNIISDNLIKDYTCLMLHPSPLPKYRGGSPIQNQIIRGEKKSAVTIFKMDNGIDTGPIAKQQEFNLEGSLNEIFKRIEIVGYNLTRDILLNGLNFTSQDNSKATTYKRLDPSLSEITIEDLNNSSFEYLQNKVRMLQDPYPNPYIKVKDGTKLFISKVEAPND